VWFVGFDRDVPVARGGDDPGPDAIDRLEAAMDGRRHEVDVRRELDRRSAAGVRPDLAAIGSGTPDLSRM
jgi:hypothetical protein